MAKGITIVSNQLFELFVFKEKGLKTIISQFHLGANKYRLKFWGHEIVLFGGKY